MVQNGVRGKGGPEGLVQIHITGRSDMDEITFYYILAFFSFFFWRPEFAFCFLFLLNLEGEN